MTEIHALECQLLGWKKSTSRSGPSITLLLQDDEDIAFFEALTLAKGKTAGQILDVAFALNSQDGQSKEADQQQAEEQAPFAMYGEHAKALYTSSFFRTPQVWKAVGTDAEFLSWIRKQPSAFSREYSEYINGEGRCEAAHVRRVANGSGTAIKPEYSAIPLTKEEHRLQHGKGESTFGGKEFFDRERIRHLHLWCWETLKSKLGFEHWNQVPPKSLYQWAEKHGVNRLLPACYFQGGS